MGQASYNDWGFTCGRIAALEGLMMPYEFFVSLAQAARPEDLFHRLQDSAAKDWMVPGASAWEDWGALLEARYSSQVESLWRDTPAAELPNMFLLPNDYLNLKRALRGQSDFPFPAVVFNQDCLNAAAVGDYGLLPESLRPVLSDWQGISSPDPLVLDAILDGACLHHILESVTALESTPLNAWAEEYVLYRVIVMLWRAANAGRSLKDFQRNLPSLGRVDNVLGGLYKAPTPEAWEGLLPGALGEAHREVVQHQGSEPIAMFCRLMDNVLTAETRRLKLTAPGPERVMAYCWGVRVETSNYKLAISGSLNRIAPDLLSERLRECYV